MADKKTKKQGQILSAIARIHQSIGVNLELVEVARILVDELVTMVGASGCAILLIEGNIVRVLAQKGFSKMLEKQGFSADMPAIRYLVNSKQSIFTGDMKSGFASGCAPARGSTRSLICSPVMVNGKVRGIIHLDSPNKDAFDEEDLYFVELLAREMSLSMERAFLHSQVKALSIRDNLTGCYNRKKLDEDIEAEIARARRYEKPLSLFMIDVDWLRKYNDFHGHSMGDLLLKKIAGILRRNVRNIDKVYRYGGEEFVILLPETDKWKALTVARRLHKIIGEREFGGERESQPNKRVTVSIGMASYPWDGNHKDELFKSADNALYRAKQSGRNTVCVYSAVKVNSSKS